MSAQGKYAVERVGDWGTPGADYQTATFTTSDGLNLFYRRWQASETAPTLALMHGLGAHSGWFIDMGAELRARGLNVLAIDHRGFGRSDGPRGHVREGAVYPRDITAFLAARKAEAPASKFFILGHSMGAIFSLFVAAEDATRRQPMLSGVALVNPWIDDTAKVSPLAFVGLIATGVAGSAKPFAAAGGTETMTTNPEAIAMLDADSYWVRAESASFLFQVTRMRLATVGKARQVRAPALVIQCDADKAVKRAASRKMFDALGSADKTWKTYPGFAHDFEFEPGRSVLDDDVSRWVMEHNA